MLTLRTRFRLAILVLSLAGVPGFAASNYKVTLPNDVSIAGTKMKSGEYGISIQGKEAIFKKGKQTTSIPVDVEKSPTKFSDTSIEMSGTLLHQINLGGTDTILVFQISH